jgi:hypothetical protein
MDLASAEFVGLVAAALGIVGGGVKVAYRLFKEGIQDMVRESLHAHELEEVERMAEFRIALAMLDEKTEYIKMDLSEVKADVKKLIGMNGSNPHKEG